MYERTLTANGELSDWNAAPVLVDKPGSTNGECRVTFNYRNVVEDMPGCFLELMAKVHDYLSHPEHKGYHQLDLKHAYWSIPVYPPHRYLFAFTIPGIGQLQPCRMPQGSHTAGFSLTELMYLVLGEIPPNDDRVGQEPSLLTGETENTLPPCCFYMDDVFSGFSNYDTAFKFLEENLLPRLLWAKLRLSFKKLRLFMHQVKALGVLHSAGGSVHILPDRVDKIRNWPVPKNASDVRGFNGAINITRRWIKNFGEIQRPLSRLTGKVEWRWEAAEQLSFSLLKERVAQVIEMFGWDFLKPVKMYTDASLYAGGCCVTQPIDGVDAPLLYDSTTFSKAERNYGTYKRELLAMATFAKKYDYMLRHPEPSIILTDHHPLVYFLESSQLEGIYARWAAELRLLNVKIEYIRGPKNRVADALSRTIFTDPDCVTTPEIDGVGFVDHSGDEPRWVWKDGKGGYEELLKQIGTPVQEKMQSTEWRKVLFGHHDEKLAGSTNADAKFMEHLRVSYYHYNPVSQDVVNINAYPVVVNPDYHASSWYKDIVLYLTGRVVPYGLNRVQTAAFMKKAGRYQLKDGVLFYNWHDRWRRCIVQDEVSRVIHCAHDGGGHFAAGLTLRRLRDVFWPRMVRDVSDYILGCLPCASHGPATRSQTLSKILVHGPNELWGIDFIGPFPGFETCPFRFILLIIDYFSRFIWAYACVSNDQDETIACLDDLFSRYGVPIAFYSDEGPHFQSRTQDFARERGITWITSPVAAKRSTGMAEKANDLLQLVLKKSGDPSKWHLRLRTSTFSVNGREVTHLGFAPFEIHHGYRPDGLLETTFPTHHRQSVASELQRIDAADLHDFTPPIDEHTEAVFAHMLSYQERLKQVRVASELQKEYQKTRFDRGVRHRSFTPGQLVMLYDKESSKKKLRPSWRGPFVITGPGGDHEKSFQIRQIDGTPIKFTYHGDHLKVFRLREGYLRTGEEESLPVYQNIRLGRAFNKLPRAVRTIPGALTSRYEYLGGVYELFNEG